MAIYTATYTVYYVFYTYIFIAKLIMSFMFL